MAAYVVVDIEVTDPVAFEEYRKGVPATVAKYGGRYIVRGGKSETLEGGWVPQHRGGQALVLLRRVQAVARHAAEGVEGQPRPGRGRLACGRRWPSCCAPGCSGVRRRRARDAGGSPTPCRWRSSAKPNASVLSAICTTLARCPPTKRPPRG